MLERCGRMPEDLTNAQTSSGASLPSSCEMLRMRLRPTYSTASESLLSSSRSPSSKAVRAISAIRLSLASPNRPNGWLSNLREIASFPYETPSFSPVMRQVGCSAIE